MLVASSLKWLIKFAFSVPNAEAVFQVIVLYTSPNTFTVNVLLFLGSVSVLFNNISIVVTSFLNAPMLIFCSLTNPDCNGMFKINFSIAVAFAIP